MLTRCLVLFVCLSTVESAFAQFKEDAPTIKAVGGPCKNVVATLPGPTDWPEQKVQIIEEDVSAVVKRVGYRTLGGTVKQMLIEVPHLASGQEAKALITFEIQRSTLAPPTDTSMLPAPGCMLHSSKSGSNVRSPQSGPAEDWLEEV